MLQQLIQTIQSTQEGSVDEDDSSSPDGLRQILHHCEGGNIAAIKQVVLQWDGNLEMLINIKGRYGQTPLYKAASRGYTDIVKFLIELGCDVDKCSASNQTPLHVSLKNGHLDVAAQLLAAGASPDGAVDHTPMTTTPLSDMCQTGNLQAVRILLEHGASIVKAQGIILACNVAHQPQQFALVYKHYHCLKLLLLNGFDPNFIIQTKQLYLFYFALKYKAPDCVFVLLHEFGTSVYAKTVSGLYIWQSRLLNPPHPLLKYFCDVPRSLMSCCRLQLLKMMGKNLHQVAHTLNVPVFLQSYLAFEDLQLPTSPENS